MRICCLPFVPSFRKRMGEVSCNGSIGLFLLFILVQTLSTIRVDGKCLHDYLEPVNRGRSPQRYKHMFKGRINYRNVVPTPTFSLYETTSSDSSYNPAPMGYFYRYRYVRYKTTPGVKRRKRFVDEDSNSTSIEEPRSDVTNRTSLQRPMNSTKSVTNRSSYNITKTGVRTNKSNTETHQEDHVVTAENLFRPIRVHLFFDDGHIDFPKESKEYGRLRESLQRAVEEIQKLLSVIPVDGPLLFTRTAENICNGFWSDKSSSNHQRCGIRNIYYDGEKCLDGFKIPDDHLMGYAIYKNKDDPNPTTILFQNGTGLEDTDTVIYVRADKTSKCKDKGVIAYATYCQLDQHNRPIAGFANFCPDHLHDNVYEKDTLFLTALHEFFHALGFSKDLFGKFQECHARKVEVEDSGKEEEDISGEVDMQWTCESRGKTINFINDRRHIVTPAVTRETQNHLNCSSARGCPLENYAANRQQTSHWESRFMQGSIMAPSIGLPHLTSIDRITLGAFEDMGWYHVNYSEAQDLLWGKKAGCDFAVGASCFNNPSPYFCNNNKISRGCHFLHLDKGQCQSDQYLQGCQVYKARTGSECWRSQNRSSAADFKTGEIYTPESRCFLSNLISDSYNGTLRATNAFQGLCYEHRCNGSNILEVKVDGSDWKLCKEGSLISFDGYSGSIQCPSASLLCATNMVKARTKTMPTVTDSPQKYTECATVKITFNKLVKLISEKKNEFDSRFLAKFVNEITALTDMNKTRITNLEFLDDSTVRFGVLGRVDSVVETESGSDDVTGSSNYDNKEISCAEAMRRLWLSVSGGNFKVPLDGELHIAKSINISSDFSSMNEFKTVAKPPPPPTQPSTTGTTAAITVGVVCGTMLLSVGAILYWKSQVTSAVSPAPPSPTSTDVRYQPNNGTTATPSEQGSMGQLVFMA